MATLARRLARLELLAPATPRVWIEDLDDDGMLVCQRTGERLAVEDARRLGAGHIVVLYADDWRGREPRP